MTQGTLSADNNSTPAESLQPPEQRFWKRHSPHHEFPLSGVTSFTLHAIILLALVFGAKLLFQFGMKLDKSDPIGMDVIEVPGGGGGNPQGVGTGPDGLPVPGPENVPDPPEKTPVPPEVIKNPEIPEVKGPEVEIGPLPESTGRVVAEAKTTAGESFTRLSEDIKKKLISQLVPPPGKGKRGTVSGKDTGDGVSSGKAGTLNSRVRRMLRWRMLFNTRDGNDYARQLHDLRAILAIPGPEGATASSGICAGGQFRATLRT